MSAEAKSTETPPRYLWGRSISITYRPRPRSPAFTQRGQNHRERTESLSAIPNEPCEPPTVKSVTLAVESYLAISESEN